MWDWILVANMLERGMMPLLIVGFFCAAIFAIGCSVQREDGGAVGEWAVPAWKVIK